MGVLRRWNCLKGTITRSMLWKFKYFIALSVPRSLDVSASYFIYCLLSLSSHSISVPPPSSHYLARPFSSSTAPFLSTLTKVHSVPWSPKVDGAFLRGWIGVFIRPSPLGTHKHVDDYLCFVSCVVSQIWTCKLSLLQSTRDAAIFTTVSQQCVSASPGLHDGDS